MATQTTNLHLTKPDGSEKVNIATINTNMDTIDTYAGTNNASIINLAEDIGVVVNGNKTKSGVTAAVGQYVILKNSTISNRVDGLYTAAKAIPANTAIDASYLTAVSGGGLNALNAKINTEISNKSYYFGTVTGSTISDMCSALYTLINNATSISSKSDGYFVNGEAVWSKTGYMAVKATKTSDFTQLDIVFNGRSIIASVNISSGEVIKAEELAIKSDVNTLTGTGTYLTSYEIKYTKVGHVCTFSVTFVPNTDIASSTGMTYVALPIPDSSVVNIYPVAKDNESFNTADVQNRFAGIVRDGQATRFKAVGNYTSGTSYSFSGSYVTAN